MHARVCACMHTCTSMYVHVYVYSFIVIVCFMILPCSNKFLCLRSRQCSSGELYKFGWTLYVYTKGHFPLVNGDLVNSHHLLLCCMDMFYSNAVMHERRDLLNVEFAGNLLLSNYVSIVRIDINLALELPNEAKRGEEFKPPEEPPCVMDYLCSKYNGSSITCFNV